MIQRMDISKNSKMCYLINNSFNDQRSLMQSNFNIISKAWRTGSSSSLSSECSSIMSFSLFSATAQNDKPVVHVIRDVKGFMDGDQDLKMFIIIFYNVVTTSFYYLLFLSIYFLKMQLV